MLRYSVNDLLFRNDVAILHGSTPYSCHLHITHHVREGQTEVGSMDGHPCASFGGTGHRGHL